MASSPSHKFGQIIGDLLEEIMGPQLQDFCDQRGLYLDKKGERGAARAGKKVSWQDKLATTTTSISSLSKAGPRTNGAGPWHLLRWHGDAIQNTQGIKRKRFKARSSPSPKDTHGTSHFLARSWQGLHGRLSGANAFFWIRGRAISIQQPCRSICRYRSECRSRLSVSLKTSR